MKAIEVVGLSYRYPSTKRNASPRLALDQVDLRVEPGEIFGLLGPNGGGKSTLFKILSTQLQPDQGQARILEKNVVSQSHEVRTSIGVVFQHPSLDRKLTLSENLYYQGRLYGLRGKDLARRVDESLQQLKLTDRAGDMVEHLSGGLARRGEIAKGLLHKPRVLLMDEPSTGLDPGARRDLLNYLKSLQKEGVSVLLTTHLMEEADQCDRLAILNHGKCVATGRPNDLKSKIGGDVISLKTQQPEALRQKIESKFGGRPTLLNGDVRLERKNGHEFIPTLVETFPGLIEAITVGKPTLEDVFVHETGETSLWGRT